MPIYEYQCESCEHIFEVRQKFSDPLVESCIKCGKPVRKLISPPGIMFKGTGWYVTDYSNKLKDPNQAKTSAAGDGKQDKGTSGDSKGGGTGSITTKSESSSSPSSTPSPTSSASPSSSQASSSSPSKSGGS